MKHTYRGIFLRRPSSSNRRTTIGISIVDRAGRTNRTASPGEFPWSRSSCYDRTQRFSITLCLRGQQVKPLCSYAISSVLLFVRGLDDRKFPLLENFSCCPNAHNGVGKALGESGVVDFRSSTGRPSGATAFQFDRPSSGSVISSMDGSSPTDSSNRGGERSMIVGSSSSGFAFKSLS